MLQSQSQGKVDMQWIINVNTPEEAVAEFIKWLSGRANWYRNYQKKQITVKEEIKITAMADTYYDAAKFWRKVEIQAKGNKDESSC